MEADFSSLPIHESNDLRYLHDLTARILHRGVGTLPSIAVERLVASLYGSAFAVTEIDNGEEGPIEWGNDNALKQLYLRAMQFSDCVSNWPGDPGTVPLDPKHPENERRLLRQLLNHYGPKFASCLYTQVHISDLLPTERGQDFLSQRIDFLISLPNGQRLILEPGDHHFGETPLAQQSLDLLRDSTLAKIGIPTLRFVNARIGTPELITDIDALIQRAGGLPFFATSVASQNNAELMLGHLIMLPTLVARIEHVLDIALLQRGLLMQQYIDICVVEQDLECAEIALYSFLQRLTRLAALNNIDLALPTISLTIVRSGRHSCTDLAELHKLLAAFGCEVAAVDHASPTRFDLSLDVSITANNLTLPLPTQAIGHATIRNTHPHWHKHRFTYAAGLPRETELLDSDLTLLETFLGDFFRKKKLRDGQFPIIKNVMAQKATIGLLPTSAGKSICFQLASLLTPGITLVVDPIIFLMKDQVLGLSEQYGITTVAAWHAEARYVDEQVGDLMATNLMIFLSPERFLRSTFRTAMKNLTVGDLFVNYAVIDEAHCVSMWGHDFRPSYLMLERCLRDYCSLGGRSPVIVALTGTASQLVLIDLKRQLNIEVMDSIIRPKTFERPELRYNIVQVSAKGKKQALSSVLRAIEMRMGIQDIKREAHGVLFANIPNQVWELYSEMAGDADEHVFKVASGSDPEEDFTCGMACGGKPKTSPVSPEQWKQYKDKILPHFKRGKVRMLIGNAAIGVGIDNEYVNYVVVYCLPSSLESLGQQWGRAGRRGQRSQCYLTYSDDQQAVTDRWLNGDLAVMPKRYDDLGTISWFHSQAFPGEKDDTQGTMGVLRSIFSAPLDGDGRRAVRDDKGERAQRFLSFLIMMGLVEDYEATGTGANTRFRVLLPAIVADAILANDNNRLEAHLIGSIQKYLSRYRPTTEKEVSDGFRTRPEERLSGKAVGYLINFIYSRIAYQRKESIRTITAFCRETDLSNEAIQRRLKAFFDRNPKFSDRLDAMASNDISITGVMEILLLIEGYDDAEHLFWETRRLLDERFRADWAAVNLLSVIYREMALSRNSTTTFQQMLEELDQRLSPDPRATFLVGFFNGVHTLDKLLGAPLSEKLLFVLFGLIFQRYGPACLPVLDGISCNADTKLIVRASLATKQVEGLLNVVRRKHHLG